MTDIVERLRAGTGGGKHWMDLHEEAADAIDALRQRVAELNVALLEEAAKRIPLMQEAHELRERVSELQENGARLLEVSNGAAAECLELRQRVADLEEANRTLRAFFEYESTCPCCDTTDVCVDDCTFATDLPDDAERMQHVRDVLRETEI